MSGTVTTAARRVLLLAIEAHRDDPVTTRALHTQLARLDEPLRVAIAGKVKAGKSTLLNALVGEQVAPTDAGECTRVVTWYRDGPSPRITLQRRDAPPTALPVRRRDGALVIDLGEVPAERVDRLTVDWPSQSLRVATLIDTPGIASATAENSRRTVAFLDPDDDAPTEADAVIYLMRHLHAADAQFLESFRDRGVARAGAVHTIAVISRADEIGGGRVDAMFAARGIAQRYRADPTVRGLCQNVVAVAGLIAETGRTLRQTEFAAMAALAAEPKADLESQLRSVDRFLRGPDPAGRRQLLQRFGIFGVRLSTSLIRQGASSPAALATELVARSGLGELQRVLQTQFMQRRDLLKARSALLAVDSVLRTTQRGAALRHDIERILAGAHELAELRLLATLRSGQVELPKGAAVEAERLLGDAGASAACRLGSADDATPDQLRQEAFAALDRWQRHAVNPMFSRNTVDACRVLVRSCEGIVAALPAPGAGPRPASGGVHRPAGTRG
jgi:50S ribosome-binding GTPase